MAKYGKKAGKQVAKAMHERKRGKLKSGSSAKTVKSRKQAVAIGLSKARKAGAKVPPKKKGGTTSGKRPAKRAAKQSSAKKSAAKKRTGGKRSSR